MSYKGFRFPREIISHAVWLYHRFSLTFGDVEELLYGRGVTVLDILVQSRRNKGTVKKFFRKLLKGCEYVPRVIITDRLGS